MTKRIISLGVLLIMALGVLAGCADGADRIDFIVSAEDGCSDASRNQSHSLIKIIRSLSELEAECNEWYTFTIDKNEQEISRDYYLRRMTSNYSETYFADNALMLYLFVESNGGNRIKIKSITKLDGVATVNAIRMIPKDSSPAVVVYWTLVIEIQQVDVADISNVEISASVRR